LNKASAYLPNEYEQRDGSQQTGYREKEKEKDGDWAKAEVDMETTAPALIPRTQILSQK
jgi:hypothetical protein